VRAHHSRGGSPRRACALRPVTEVNCVAARRGGEQTEVNDQPETKVNPIRPTRAASLLPKGEAQTERATSAKKPKR